MIENLYDIESILKKKDLLSLNFLYLKIFRINIAVGVRFAGCDYAESNLVSSIRRSEKKLKKKKDRKRNCKNIDKRKKKNRGRRKNDSGYSKNSIQYFFPHLPLNLRMQDLVCERHYD